MHARAYTHSHTHTHTHIFAHTKFLHRLGWARERMPKLFLTGIFNTFIHFFFNSKKTHPLPLHICFFLLHIFSYYINANTFLTSVQFTLLFLLLLLFSLKSSCLFCHHHRSRMNPHPMLWPGSVI